MFKKYSIVLFTAFFVIFSTEAFAARQISSPKPTPATKPAAPASKPSFGNSVKPAPTPSISNIFGSSTKSTPVVTPKPVTVEKPVTSPIPNSSTRGEVKPTSNASTIRKEMYKSKDGNTLTKPQVVEQLKKSPDLEKKFPTRFSSEPTVRPAYVPQTYRATNGQNVNITYNNGGYGYMDPVSHIFMTLAIADMLADDRVVQVVSNQQGYSTQPIYIEQSNRHGYLIFSAFMIMVIILCIGAYYHATIRE